MMVEFVIISAEYWQNARKIFREEESHNEQLLQKMWCKTQRRRKILWNVRRKMY